jgi:Bacterial Ig-like domain (group 3)
VTRRFSLPAIGLVVTIVALLAMAAPAMAVPPTFTNPPQISGTAQQGSTLIETSADWSGQTSLTIQWQDCDATVTTSCTDISGANGSTYKVQPGDVNQRIRVVETATNVDGPTTAMSAVTAVVIPPAPGFTTPPQISGKAQQGSTLMETPADWSGQTSVTIQWRDCDGSACTDIAAANGSAYTLTANDIGHTIVVQETAVGPGGQASATSAATSPVLPAAPSNTAAPGISGFSEPGQTLTEVRGNWTDHPTVFTYQWYACDSQGNNCSPLAGQTGQTYMVTPNDLGKRIVVVETASNPGGDTPASSAPTAAVGRGSTATSIDVSNPTVDVGGTATYLAIVTPIHAGSLTPTGSVAFVDGGVAIQGCSAQPISGGVARCTVSYPSAGTHSITARYLGDSNFTGSASSTQAVAVHAIPPRVLGIIKATMQWTFFYAPSFTTIRNLVLNGAPVGANVSVACHGRSCPFKVDHVGIQRPKPCHATKGHKCHAPRAGTLDLLGRFRRLRHRHLRVGTQIVVMITKRQWIGKYYSFTVRRAHSPHIRIDCLAPGGTKPGVGC